MELKKIRKRMNLRAEGVPYFGVLIIRILPFGIRVPYFRKLPHKEPMESSVRSG